MNNGTIVTKRRVISVIGVIIAALFFLSIWHYYHTGTIVITTNGSSSSNTISLSKVKSGDDDEDTASSISSIKQGTGRLSVSVPLGTYIASVNGRVLSISKTIDLSRHETLRYTLNAPQTTTTESVVSATTSGIVANSSELLYLDISTNKIREINSQNGFSIVGGNNLESVAWADTGYGIAQDINKKLYIINNGSIMPLRLPETFPNSQTVLYSIAKNRQIYLAFGPRIYAGNATTGFKKIYTAKIPPDKIVASNSGVLIFSIPDVDDNDDGDEAEATLINNDLKTYTLDVSLNDAAWSPDGTKIALVGDGTNSLIVNNSLKQLAVLPNNGIGALTWANNHTLIYGLQNAILSYNLNSGQSQVIADLQTGSTITQTILDDNDKYLYVASQSDNGGEIDRIGLDGQQAPEVSYQISAFFPDIIDNGSCSVSYVNFAQPTLNVVAASGLVDCQSAVQSALQQDGIPANQLRINYSVAPGGD